MGGLGDPSVPYAQRRSKRRKGKSGGSCLSRTGEGEELLSRKGLVTNSEYRDAGELGKCALAIVEGSVSDGVVLVGS